MEGMVLSFIEHGVKASKHVAPLISENFHGKELIDTRVGT